MPPIICVNDAMEACKVVELFRRLLTKEREERREQEARKVGNVYVFAIILQLQEYVHSDEAILKILATIPDISSEQDIILLKDVFGSIHAISQASEEDILNRTPCSRATARAVSQFFGN